MARILILFISVLFLGSCSEPPAYNEVVANFKENKATFSMIAAIACEIGADQQDDTYQINGQTQQELDLIELAETIDIDAIKYSEREGQCTLKMPVWKQQSNGVSQSVSYRYNVNDPALFDGEDRFESLVSGQSSVTDEITSDKKLSKRWFITVSRKSV